MEAILTGLSLSNFETTKCKNSFDTNSVKVHSAVIHAKETSSFIAKCYNHSFFFKCRTGTSGNEEAVELIHELFLNQFSLLISHLQNSIMLF